MPANISFNPLLVSVAPGTFSVQSDGYIQGTMLDDPAVRYALAGGVLAPTETLPMWGGIAIFESIGGAPGGPVAALGSSVGRANSVANIGGFSVFNQASAWLTTPQSECPSAGVGMTVPFFRLGSGARIAVQCDPDLASLIGGTTSPQVSWDFNDQILQPYVASGATEAVTSMTWSNTNGGQVAVVMAAASVFGLGDVINVSGATNTGTAGAAPINTAHVINSFTDSTHFTFLLPGTGTQYGTIGGTIVLNVGTGALPVKVIDVAIGNSKVVSYDPVNNYVHWNNNGSAAVIVL